VSPLSNIPTAAPLGSLGRVSVPVWLIIRKDQRRIIGLVSLYLTNYLILRGLIEQRDYELFRIWSELRIPTRYAPVRHFACCVPRPLTYHLSE